MRFREGPKKHFTGKPGVYYQPSQNAIWLFRQAEIAMVFNERQGLVETYKRYDIESDGVNEQKIIVQGNTLLIFLGEL